MFKYTVILTILLTAACGDKTKDDKPKAVATVNGVPVTASEFEAFKKFKRVSTDDKERQREVLEKYTEREALASAIEKSDVLDNSLIGAELNEFRKEMLISRYFEAFLKEKVNDRAILDYYNSNAKAFEEEKVKVAHILVRVNDRMEETEKQAKLTKINEAHSKITAGEDFASIAEAMSEDKISAKKGGDIGWIKKDAVDPVFTEAVFGMKKGDVSKPIKTKFGYHIALVLEEKKVVRRPLRAVEGDIRYRLREEAKKAEMDRLKAKMKVEIL